jgi:hypothetical protein
VSASGGGKAGAVEKASTMQRIIFASDGPPDRLDDQARFSLWHDRYTAHYGALEIFRPHDRPFSMQCKFERVQNLLAEAGSSFTAGVLELRLQRARAMLADARHDRLKIGEISDQCGFSEIPYFNHCFRRRFGASPKQLRNSRTASSA